MTGHHFRKFSISIEQFLGTFPDSVELIMKGREALLNSVYILGLSINALIQYELFREINCST